MKPKIRKINVSKELCKSCIRRNMCVPFTTSCWAYIGAEWTGVVEWWSGYAPICSKEVQSDALMWLIAPC